MSIQTVFAHISCGDLKTSLPWYEKLFGKPPIRQPMPGLAEWQFTDSAEVQLFEDKTHAGYSTLTPACCRSNRSASDSSTRN